MPSSPLPTDVVELQRLLLQSMARVEHLETAKARSEAHNAELSTALVDLETAKAWSEAKLHAQLEDVHKRMDALIRRLFGRKTERIAVNQIQLFGENGAAAAEQALRDETPEADAPSSTSTKPRPRRKKKRGGGRRALPDHLERIEVSSKETGPTECGGCGAALKVIGTDRSERLDYLPAKVRVLVTVREKRACACCPDRGVVTQPAPAWALDKALCGDSLLAKVLTDKFADHIPLNRQAKRFEREAGVHLAVSTMCGWVRRSADLLAHVVDAIADELKSGRFIQSDATGLPILHGAKNKPTRGHFWSYTDGTQVVMKATLNGKQSHPADFLDGFEGTLLTDGASAYNAAAGAESVVRAGCWAHARRKFFEARQQDPVRAGRALATIRDVFLVERTVQGLSPEDRARVRRERLEDKLKRLRVELLQWSTTTRPSSPMGKAITYALNQWDTLVVFLSDGTAPPHNNTSERLLRKPVIGRKNWLFAGSEGGAHAAAVHFSIVLSCELAGVDPLAYLRDVLGLLPDAKPSEVRALTPLRWAERFGPKAENAGTVG